MNVIAAMQDVQLFGRAFHGPTWNAWRALLAGAFALPMTVEQVATFRLLTDREPPAAPVAELWTVAGRRAGKSRIAAMIAVYLAACRKWPAAVGEVPVVLMLAADREQARVMFRYALGLLRASPLLAREVTAETRDSITLASGVELQVGTSDFRAVRGRSIVAALLDEVAFWNPTAESANPDTEVLAALRPALSTFPGSLLVAISSPYAQRGALYETWRRYHGQPDARVLVARAPSRALNPGIPEHVIADAIERDPLSAQAEWLAEFRSDVASFMDAQLVDGATRSEPRELPPLTFSKDGGHVVYHAGLDISGGRSDAAACAVAHRDGARVIVDACRRWPAPHDPAVVATQVADFLKPYRLLAAAADQYGAELSRSIYSEAGIALTAATVNRSEAYLHLLPLMTTGRIELPPEPRLRVELLGFERRTSRGGRDSVDHRPGSHDDLANAVALAAWAANRSGDGSDEVVAFYSDLAFDRELNMDPLHPRLIGDGPWN